MSEIFKVFICFLFIFTFLFVFVAILLYFSLYLFQEEIQSAQEIETEEIQIWLT